MPEHHRVPLVRTARRRPDNRRQSIVDAAVSLFATRGFEAVAMSDIAAAVDVGPSALYRHFAGKEDLLSAAIDQTLDRFAAAVAGPPTGPLGGPSAGPEGRLAVLHRVAEFAVAYRSATMLWTREVRHLPADQRSTRMQRLADVHWQFACAATASTSPDLASQLRARAALAVLLSPAFHGVVIAPFARFCQILIGVAVAVLDTSVSAPSGAALLPDRLGRKGKRDQILSSALEIFADQTYASTGLEEIAAAAGLSTSSVYNHFASKVEILETVLYRCNGYLQLTLDDALWEAVDQALALRRLVTIYANFAVRHPRLVNVFVMEVRSLGERAEPFRQAQRDYVAEWIHLCRASRPELDAATAQVIVQAALMAMNDVARDRAFAAVPDLGEPLAKLAVAALGI